VLVPSLGKKGQLGVDGAEEEEMQKPDMGNIVDVKAIPQFKEDKSVTPCCTDLGCDINPQTLNANIVNTPEYNK
jgi:hypothetical protein